MLGIRFNYAVLIHVEWYIDSAVIRMIYWGCVVL